MKKIKCVVVDDEPLARKVIKNYILEIEELDFLAELTSALELKSYLKNNDVDIVFLDINMPKLSGLEYVKNFDINSTIVFTTAYPEFAVDAFEYEAADYLLKPIPFERFLKCIDKVKLKHSNELQRNDWITIKENKRLYQVQLNKIQYIQAYGDYVKIICTDKSYLVKDKFSSILKQLNERFAQCHRSYSVNLDQIKFMEGNHLVIDENKIPISNSFKDEFLKHFT